MQALRSARPIEYVRQDSAARSAAGFPPGGEVLVLEVTDPPPDAAATLIEAVGDRGGVLGPAETGNRFRWLIQGTDLNSARVAVRAVVARWREGGSRVRIDADPVDL